MSVRAVGGDISSRPVSSQIRQHRVAAQAGTDALPDWGQAQLEEETGSDV